MHDHNRQAGLEPATLHPDNPLGSPDGDEESSGHHKVAEANRTSQRVDADLMGSQQDGRTCQSPLARSEGLICSVYAPDCRVSVKA